MNKTVSILGSTGSIGTQSLEVCEKHGLKVVALAAHSSIEALEQQIRKFRPKYACIYNQYRAPPCNEPDVGQDRLRLSVSGCY